MNTDEELRAVLFDTPRKYDAGYVDTYVFGLEQPVRRYFGAEPPSPSPSAAEASIREQMRRHQDRWNSAHARQKGLEGCKVLIGHTPNGPFATLLDLTSYAATCDTEAEEYNLSAVYYPNDANAPVNNGSRVWIVVTPTAGQAYRQCCDAFACTGTGSVNGSVRISVGLRAVAPRETLTDSLLEFGAIKPSRLVIPGYSAP